MTLEFSHESFKATLGKHQRLIELANDLELRLYALGEQPDDCPTGKCQQAGGALLGLLREVLFEHDQQVLPLLESLASRNSSQ